LPKLEEMKNFQIEGSRNLEMNENNLKKLHAQKVFWKRNRKIALCWAFYYVNDNKKISVTTSPIMHCILCHKNPILNVNPKTQVRKGLIIYNTTNYIVTLSKDVNSNHLNHFGDCKPVMTFMGLKIKNAHLNAKSCCSNQAWVLRYLTCFGSQMVVDLSIIYLF